MQLLSASGFNNLGFISFCRCLGNVTPVNREPLQMTFSPFRENRLSVVVRVTDPAQPPTCRLAFLKEPRKDRQGNVRTICNLSIDLSEEVRHKQLLSLYLLMCFQAVRWREHGFQSIGTHCLNAAPILKELKDK